MHAWMGVGRGDCVDQISSTFVTTRANFDPNHSLVFCACMKGGQWLAGWSAGARVGFAEGGSFTRGVEAPGESTRGVLVLSVISRVEVVAVASGDWVTLSRGVAALVNCRT